MLNNTYTVGTAPYALVLTKQFDTNKSSTYSVAGLSASVARSMTIAHEIATNNQRRTNVSHDYTYAIPGSTSGQTYKDRAYLVVQRGAFTSAADAKGMINTLVAQIQSTGFLDALLNGEL